MQEKLNLVLQRKTVEFPLAQLPVYCTAFLSEPDEGMDVDVAHLYYTQLLSAVVRMVTAVNSRLFSCRHLAWISNALTGAAIASRSPPATYFLAFP